MQQDNIFIYTMYPLFVDGIKALIKADKNLKSRYIIAGHSDNNENVLKICKGNQIDILIINDTSISKEKIINLMHNLPQILAQNKILFLTNRKDSRYIAKLSKHGIRIILSSKIEREKFLKAVELISSKKTHINFTANSFSSYVNDEIKDISPLSLLSNREIEILKLRHKSMSNKEISSLLYISVKTVENHIENIKNKCRLKHVSDIYKLKLSE